MPFLFVLVALGALRSPMTLDPAALRRAGPTPQEAPAPSSGDELAEVLAGLDRRIYVPAGIRALHFVIRPGSKGEGARADFRVRYSWRDGVGDRIDILDDDGNVLDRIPGYMPSKDATEELVKRADKNERTLRAHFLATSRELKEMVLGRTWSEHYAAWRGQVVRKTKNGEEFVSFVVEPLEPQKVRRVTVELGRDGLPWKIEKVYLSGDRVVQHPSYDARGDRFVLAKLQHVYTPGTPGQGGLAFAFVFTWQSVKGRLVLATVTKEGRDLPPEALGVTELADLRLDDDVPPFEPLR
jgi:hypothetical protein